jgi:hypothetical protein
MSRVAHVDDVDLKVLDLQADLSFLERWLRRMVAIHHKM